MLIELEDSRKQTNVIRKLVVVSAFASAVGFVGKSVLDGSAAPAQDKKTNPVQVVDNATCVVKLDRNGLISDARVRNNRGQLMYKFRNPDNIIDAVFKEQNEGTAAIPLPAHNGQTRYEKDGIFVVDLDDGVCNLDVSRGSIQVAIAPAP